MLKKLIARSNENGITFFSNVFPFVSYDTFFDEENKVQNKVVYGATISGEKQIPWIGYLISIFLMSFSIGFFTIWNNPGFIIGAFYFSMLGSSKLDEIISTKSSRSSRFHAAYHMVSDAYEQFRRIPSLDEAKKFSRFTRDCHCTKSLLIFCCIIFGCLASPLYDVNIIIFLLAATAFAMFIKLAIKMEWIKFLQVLVVSKPTDEEISLVIEALKNFEEAEEKLEKDNSITIIGKSTWE